MFRETTVVREPDEAAPVSSTKRRRRRQVKRTIVSRAWRLRQRRKKGAPLSPAESAWLDSYDARERRTRRLGPAYEVAQVIAAVSLVTGARDRQLRSRRHRKVPNWIRDAMRLLALALRRAGYSCPAIAEVTGQDRRRASATVVNAEIDVARGGPLRERVRRVEVALQAATMSALTVAQRGDVVPMYVRVGSPLWCLIDAYDEAADGSAPGSKSFRDSMICEGQRK